MKRRAMPRTQPHQASTDSDTDPPPSGAGTTSHGLDHVHFTRAEKPSARRGENCPASAHVATLALTQFMNPHAGGKMRSAATSGRLLAS